MRSRILKRIDFTCQLSQGGAGNNPNDTNQGDDPFGLEDTMGNGQGGADPFGGSDPFGGGAGGDSNPFGGGADDPFGGF